MPVAAGTDKFFEEIPLGSNRTYAKVNGATNHAAWLAAVKAGKSFVSNGPILEFDAAGHAPGEIVNFQGSQQLKGRVQARSILPFTTLEIVLNGEVVGHKTVPMDQNPPKDGIYSMAIETELNLTRSCWLAARVVDHPDLRNRILPRGVSVFAHTSPVYFLRDGQNVHETASIAYLRKWVQGMLHWLDTKPPFSTEADRLSARAAAEKALSYYQGLAKAPDP